MLKRDWIVSSNRVIYSTLNGERNREDLYIQSRNQQTYTSNNYKMIKPRKLLIFNPVFVYASSQFC
jgi:hypothetical protein